MASRRRLSCALALGLALLAPASADARPAAVIAFVSGSQAQDLSLLDEFAAAGMSVGLASAVTGGWEPGQAALDASQGTRIPTRLYDGDLPSLALRGGRIAGWDAVLRRARDAPGEVEPGLLADTLRRAGVAVRYSGSGRSAAAAADRRGRVARGLDAAVLVLDIPARDLGRLRLAAARPETLVIAIQAPSGKRLRLMPAAMAAPGREGLLLGAGGGGQGGEEQEGQERPRRAEHGDDLCVSP